MHDLNLIYGAAWALTGVVSLALVKLTFESRVHWGWWIVYAVLGPLVLLAFVGVLAVSLMHEHRGGAV